MNLQALQYRQQILPVEPVEGHAELPQAEGGADALV